MAHLLTKPICSLRAFWHRMVGRVWFRLRRPERSRQHFERVLMLHGDDFVAYFYLARLAYAAGDTAGYQRELAHAKRTSPERMARIRYLFDYFEPTPMDGAMFEETSERATWRAIRLSSVSGAPSAGAGDGNPPGTANERGISSCPEGDLRRFGDDFSSSQERRRFAELPPILPEDLASVDLDRLSDAL